MIGGMDESTRFSHAWVMERVGRFGEAGDGEPSVAGARAAALGFYRRADFLLVVRWKSARALPQARQNSARAITSATRAAFGTEDEAARLAHLLSLRGVGVPIASALLHCAFPSLYPILDYRAVEALGEPKRRTSYTAAFWLSYVERCRRLAADAGVSMRELDKALWQDSRERWEAERALVGLHGHEHLSDQEPPLG